MPDSPMRTVPVGADWSAAAPPTSEAVADLVAACVAVDRVAPLSGHVLEAMTHHGDTRYRQVLEGEQLIGVAVLPAHDPAELAVHPEFRRAGVGGGLLGAVLAQDAAVWAHGDLPAALALATRLDLRITRELLQMRRSLADPLPPVALPDGVRLRVFEPGVDDDAFLAVNARAFAWHPEQGRLDRAGLAVEMGQPWFDPAGFFLAVDPDDRVLGYHWTKVHDVDTTPPDATAAAVPIGEIYVLGVDPESPVRRLGTPLSVAGLEYLRGRGLSDVLLYVEGDNAPAVRLYERLGFTRYLTDVVYQR